MVKKEAISIASERRQAKRKCRQEWGRNPRYGTFERALSGLPHALRGRGNSGSGHGERPPRKLVEPSRWSGCRRRRFNSVKVQLEVDFSPVNTGRHHLPTPTSKTNARLPEFFSASTATPLDSPHKPRVHFSPTLVCLPQDPRSLQAGRCIRRTQFRQAAVCGRDPPFHPAP